MKPLLPHEVPAVCGGVYLTFCFPPDDEPLRDPPDPEPPIIICPPEPDYLYAQYQP